MASRPLQIAIIGAGPSGCTLARLLQVSEQASAVKVTIFEREAQLHDRDQGGTLDLHDSTGLEALRRAELLHTDEFRAIARHDGDAIVLCDKNMRRWIDIASSSDGGWLAQGKPEVDRLQLRQLLLNSLVGNVVVWNKRVSKVELATDTSSTLYFEDGSSRSGFDLVIGADGAYSIVRPLITPQKPFYSGVGGWNMLCPKASILRPLMNKMINRGSLFAFSDGKVVMGQQLGSGSIYISMWGLKPENWTSSSGYDVKDPKHVKKALLEEFKDWAPELRELLASFDETQVWPRSLVMLPTGLTWDSKPGLTIMGDAAHVMCPFVGEGVNAAMADAMELADAIKDTVKSGWSRELLAQNVEKYENGMRKRTLRASSMTEDIMKLMLFTPGAPTTTIERYFVRATSDDLPFLIRPIWKFLVNFYYFTFKAFIK
ncbi:unnamed protein product [Clonostachys solani]|uniref:FAD-binding domain-containing protein n=1 Tax=Clonostachys solani TaxID=160281 RepID=A0A9P0EP08_9HYPO|nr:unnamed protein product [Clonostachys solani]